MKKFLAAFLCAALALSMTACKEDEEPYSKNRDKESSTVSDNCSSENNSTSKSSDSKDDSTSSKDNDTSKPESETTDYEPAAESDFEFTDYGDGVQIISYLGVSGDVVIPGTLGGKPVISFGYRAFPRILQA